MAEEKFSTGIKELDGILEGGIYRGVNILIRGGAGTGKTTFALQYLVQGARQGQKGMYITFEEAGNQIVDFGNKFFPDLKSYVNNGMIQILDFSPHKAVRDGKATKSTGDEMMNSITYIQDRISDIRQSETKRVVVDGLQTFATTFFDLSDLSNKHDVEELRRTLSRILVLLKNENISTFVLSEDTEECPDKYSFVNFSVDGIIMLKVNESLDIRTLRITKMRGIKHTLKSMAMKFVDNEGILISRT
jgi:KaiC/GvpD/RAD55 family RecA-like ATPase